jgi:predicted transcriptional regulator
MAIYDLPLFQDDEDIRSIIFKCHIRSANERFSETKKELFGIKSYKSSPLPKKLSAMVIKFPNSEWVNVDYLLENHTLFPLISSFMTENSKHQLLKEIRANHDDAITTSTWSTLGNTFSLQVKYCPECMVTDFDYIGDSYIHRIHQLKFLEYCPSHNYKLITNCQICKVALSKEYSGDITLTPFCSNGHRVEMQKVDTGHISVFEKKVIEEVNWILHNNGKLRLDTMQTKFFAYLTENNYMYLSGRFNKKKLLNDMISYCGIEPFEKIAGYTLQKLSKKSNISRVLSLYYSDYTRFIYFYILLIIFLAGSIKEFVESDRSYKTDIPFGHGPWECRNERCHGNISKVKRNLGQYGKVVVGQFECLVCGLTYSRSFNLENNREIIKITSIGHSLVNEINSLGPAGVTKKQISSKLGVSKQTVQRYLKGPKEHKRKVEYRRKIKEYKEKILKIIIENESLSRTQIIKLANTEYLRLKCWNETDWLDSVLPLSKRGRTVVNFANIDIDLSQKIYKAFEVLKLNAPEYRIHFTTVLNLLDKSDKIRVQHHRDKLPITSEALKKCQESYDDYHLRKLSIVYQYFKKKKRCKKVVWDTLLNYFSSYKYITERGKELIIKRLDELNNYEMQ